MKKMVFFLLAITANTGHVFSQDMQTQLNNFAAIFPKYLDGYTQSITGNLGHAMLNGHQMQHGKKPWVVRYSMSASAALFSSFPMAEHNFISDRQGSAEVAYIGPGSGVLGSDQTTFIRKYWLDDDGQRLVHPLTGRHVYSEIEMPGGLQRQQDVIPSTIPYLELRVLKGLVLSAGFIPVGYFLRDLEREGFELKSNIWGLGASLHLSYLTDIPVLSWLRMDVSTNRLNLSINNLEGVFDPGSNTSFASFTLNEMSISSSISSTQTRLSMAIPAGDKSFLLLQGGYSSVTHEFGLDYDFTFKIDGEKAKEEYDIDLDTETYSIADNYLNTSDAVTNAFYSFGILREGRVGSFTLMYTPIPIDIVTLKFGIKIL